MAHQWLKAIHPQRDVFSSFQKRINAMFDEFWSDDPNPLVHSEFSPKVDISENQQRILVRADLPGLQQKDIDVQLANNILTIKGERRYEKESNHEKGILSETSYGCFQRSISIQENIQADHISATYKNGVLEVTIPKDEAKAPKSIQVKEA